MNSLLKSEKVPEKSRELKRIVVDTICCKISINDEMMICDPSESGCSTYSQNEINMDRHDLTIQSELENRIDKIERKIRKRSIDQSESSSSFEKKTSKKEISIHFTSEEISTDEMSGDYGDELSDDEDDLTMPEITGKMRLKYLPWPSVTFILRGNIDRFHPKPATFGQTSATFDSVTFDTWLI